MAAGGRHEISWRAAGTVFVALLALLGAGLLGAGLNGAPSRPPQPVAKAAPTSLPTTERVGPRDAGGRAQADKDPDVNSTPVAMTRSAPTSLNIPKIGVNAQVIGLGVNADGTLQVPSLEQAQLTSWYQDGPSPGEPGNAVVVGHVDSHVTGPAVFFRLGELLPGDIVKIGRADGTVATFRVDGVKSYPKTDFPTDLVYGPAGRPGLRLITCGGDFDENQRSYEDNVIVFATLTT
jgi:sortase (surface protein transpeptidase)